MKQLFIFIAICFYMQITGNAQRSGVPIGTNSNSSNTGIAITLIKRFQHYNGNTKNEHDVFDNSINSPKSVNILNSINKFYVNSLEGESTSVFDLTTFKRTKIITHVFNANNQQLVKENENESETLQEFIDRFKDNLFIMSIINKEHSLVPDEFEIF